MKQPLQFLANNPWIVRGLLSGAFTRFGGSIRDTATGRVICFLLDPPNPGERVLSDSVRTVLSGAAAWESFATLFPDGQPAGDAAASAEPSPAGGTTTPPPRGAGFSAPKFGSLPKDLLGLLQISQVSAIAECLSLGVSAAGFGYLGWRLHQVQRTVGELDKGLRSANGKLDQVMEKLDLLTLVSSEQTQKIDSLRQSLRDLREDQSLREVTTLSAALKTREEFPETPVHQVFEKAVAVQTLMKARSQQITPCAESDALLLASLAAPTWASAVAAAGQCLLSSGKGDAAARHVRGEANVFRAFAELWAGALLRDPEKSWQTAFRFQTQVFRGKIRKERVTRIARISPYDQQTTPERQDDAILDAETESRMSHRRAELSAPEEIERQEKVADFLDGLSETADRLDCLADYADYAAGSRGPRRRALKAPGKKKPARAGGLVV